MWDANARKREALPWDKSTVGSRGSSLRLGRPQTELSKDGSTGVLSPIMEEFYSPEEPPLTVAVSLRFTDSVRRQRYQRSYHSSPAFQPSDRICNGLLRRIEHCSEELITRRDPRALDASHDGLHTPKPMRFEMVFRVVRGDTGEWTERVFKSYQRLALADDAAKEVILATHRTVGLFLRRHDKDFRWLHGSTCEEYTDRPATERPAFGRPVSLSCVPRSRFVEISQSWECIPGYRIEVSFRSRNSAQPARVFRKLLHVSSHQTTPLNLVLSEDLFWQCLQAVHDAFGRRRKQFDRLHSGCEDEDLPCAHVHDEAVDVDLRISNNLGPIFDHLHRSFQSKLKLFSDPSFQDCADFLEELEGELTSARDGLDCRLNGMRDFDFRIVELRGPGWSVRNVFRHCIDSSATHSRRSVEAILDRIQAGITDVVHGRNIAVHIVAHKRGHLVVDKVLVAHQEDGRRVENFGTVEEEQQAITSRLRARIPAEIERVCKDTCSLDDLPAEETIDTPVTAEQTPQPTAPDAPKHGDFSRQKASTSQHNGSLVLSKNRDRARQSPDDKTTTTNHSSSSSIGPRSYDRMKTTPPISDGETVTVRTQRVFPLVPKSYSWSSRTSSGSTLASQNTDITGDCGHDDDNSHLALSPAAEVKAADSSGDHERRRDTKVNFDLASENAKDGVPPATLEKSLAPLGVEPAIDKAVPNDDASLAVADFARSRFDITDLLDELDRASVADDHVDSRSTTPALSFTGDSSPRNSVLVTPTYLRTLSGAVEPGILGPERVLAAELLPELEAVKDSGAFPRPAPIPAYQLKQESQGLENSPSLDPGLRQEFTATELPGHQPDTANLRPISPCDHRSASSESTGSGPENTISAQPAPAAPRNKSIEMPAPDQDVDDGVDHSLFGPPGPPAVELDGTAIELGFEKVRDAAGNDTKSSLEAQSIVEAHECVELSVGTDTAREDVGTTMKAATPSTAEPLPEPRIMDTTHEVSPADMNLNDGGNVEEDIKAPQPSTSDMGDEPKTEATSTSMQLVEIPRGQEQLTLTQPLIQPAQLLARALVLRSHTAPALGYLDDVRGWSAEDATPADGESEPAEHHHYRPSTAGYLGLHETRLVEVGLRGALAGSRRYSLPLAQLEDAASDSAAGSRPSSSRSHTKHRKRRDKGGGAARKWLGGGGRRAGDEDEGRMVLPRAIMIFAGMAFASQMLQKAA